MFVNVEKPPSAISLVRSFGGLARSVAGRIGFGRWIFVLGDAEGPCNLLKTFRQSSTSGLCNETDRKSSPKCGVRPHIPTTPVGVKAGRPSELRLFSPLFLKLTCLGLSLQRCKPLFKSIKFFPNVPHRKDQIIHDR